MDCIFCKIAKGDSPSFKFYEDNVFLAFLDIKPIRPGHALFLPKQHSENLFQTSDETLATLGQKVKMVAKAVMESMGAEGCNISINNGSAAGQDVFHTHFHIIPRMTGDNLPGWPHGELAKEEGVKLAEKIRRQISNN